MSDLITHLRELACNGHPIGDEAAARIEGLEAHIETLNGWRAADLNAAMNYIETIQGLQSGLREVYAMAGEDPQLSKIINTTLERYPFP